MNTTDGTIVLYCRDEPEVEYEKWLTNACGITKYHYRHDIGNFRELKWSILYLRKIKRNRKDTKYYMYEYF